MLTLNWSREADKGGFMMRDISAYFYCVKKTLQANFMIKTEAKLVAQLSQLIDGLYGDE